MEEKFVKNLDELVLLFDTKKINITIYLQKHFIEDINYVKQKIISNTHIRGGHNKTNYLLTIETYDMIRNTYNLKHRYLKNITSDCNHNNPINYVMSIENQTIGYIENMFSKTYNVKRQYKFGSYFTDLCFVDNNIVIECDEFGHADRDKTYETNREQYIINNNYSLIRFNPNKVNFDLSEIVREIVYLLVNKPNSPILLRL